MIRCRSARQHSLIRTTYCPSLHLPRRLSSTLRSNFSRASSPCKTCNQLPKSLRNSWKASARRSWRRTQAAKQQCL